MLLALNLRERGISIRTTRVAGSHPIAQHNRVDIMASQGSLSFHKSINEKSPHYHLTQLRNGGRTKNNGVRMQTR